jgi:hypothetical protein
MMKLTLTYPLQVWRGDEQAIALAIKPVESEYVDGKTRTTAGTYHASVEARLDLESGRITPGKTMIEPIQAGQSVQFVWRVRTDEANSLNGKLWIYLNIDKAGSVTPWRLPRFALPLETGVKDILGLSVGGFRMIVMFTLLGIAIATGMYFYLGREASATP